MAARPLEQVLEEVEQPGVRPLHVLEDEDRRRLSPRAARRGSATRRRGSPGRRGRPPRGRAGGPAAARPSCRSSGSGMCSCDRGAQLLARRRRLLVLDDARSASGPSPRAPSTRRPRRRRGSDHGATRRRRRGRRRTSRTPRRAATCRCRRCPMTETSCALLSSADAWKSSLTSRSSRSRPTNGGLETRRALSAPPRPPTTRSARKSGTGSAFPFSSCDSGVLVRDRRLGRPLRRLADEHRAGLGDRLDARGGVDEVAGDHALALRAERDRGLAGEDAARALAARVRELVASAETAATRSSAARTARSASSSCATALPRPPSRRRR